jgi:hypothetical protein
MKRIQKCNKMGLMVKNERARFFEKGPFPKCPVYSRVLLDSRSSRDLLFVLKGSTKHFSIAKRVLLQLWGTSNGTFITDKVGDIEISFVEYSASMKVHLHWIS